MDYWINGSLFLRNLDRFNGVSTDVYYCCPLYPVKSEIKRKANGVCMHVVQQRKERASGCVRESVVQGADKREDTGNIIYQLDGEKQVKRQIRTRPRSRVIELGAATYKSVGTRHRDRTPGVPTTPAQLPLHQSLTATVPTGCEKQVKPQIRTRSRNRAMNRTRNM
uniref:Uncharacterized protein n=1 Tax=Steinernema glaseri TaxID=37863 RepID=A0A1I7YJI0_9BILA